MARCLTLLAALGTVVSLLPAAPTVSDFFKRPEISALTISPNGRYATYVTPAGAEDSDLNLFDYVAHEPLRFSLKGEKLWGLYWLDDQQMVVRGWRDMVFDLGKRKLTHNVSAAPGSDYYRVFSQIKDRPLHFYVLYFRTGHNQPEIGVINAKKPPSGQFSANDTRYNQVSSLTIPSGETHYAYTDQRGEIRVMSIYRNGSLRFHFRRPDNSWVELPLDPLQVEIKKFSADPAAFYVTRRDEQTGASSLCLYNATKQEMGPVIFGDPEYSLDESSVLLSAGGTELLGLTYYRDRQVQVAFSPVFKEVLARAEDALPDSVNLITSYDDKLLHFSLLSHNARETHALVLERGPRGFSELAAPYPQLPSQAMRPMRVVHFTSRDGLKLEGYLTLPDVGYGDPKPPLLVVPHDGPWERDTWGFNRKVQFFANRGYAVFQPNYRGSTGYLKPITVDGKYAFRKMHEDVTDGVQYVISTGAIDPARIGIFGSGFGGFLAVSGVAFEPDLYRCAATYAGIFDWKKLVGQRKDAAIYDRFEYDQLIKNLGDPEKNPALFDEISPIGHLQKVKAPVYVAHGKEDATVDVSQSKKLLEELRKLQIPVESLFLSDEGHAVYDVENEVKFYTGLEAFLEKHLKGAAPAGN